MTNRLSRETSPYLLQHAHNPVDWHPWGTEALEIARREDRPILLSIGYSACHWCHVMERESFEDPSIAALMNERFVNIKVDREERPDLDGIYMRAVQSLTGGGGWPLTAFLTPDARPFYGGTYYPPEPRHGMPSFRMLLEAVSEAWTVRRDEVMASAERLKGILEALAAPPETGPVSGLELAHLAHGHLRSRFDPALGGFGQAPKFPQPTTLEFLLAFGVSAGEPEALDMVVTTLRAMAGGGIRDHLGGGFHRYSVDSRWLVPHFEKMLYDNALLARLYIDAWRATGEDDLRAVAEETMDYLVADLRDAGGGFYAARDADSDGVEGRFYVWTPDEVQAVLDDPEAARLFGRAYDVQPGGNFEGTSILHLPHPLEAVARAESLAPEELGALLADARAALLEARAARIAPFRDEKVLCSWSAMAVRALAEGGTALGRVDLLARAEEGGRFLLDTHRVEGELHRVWTAGVVKVPAFLEDWAALGNACVSLHEATLDLFWLEAAASLAEDVLTRFWDSDSGLFHDSGAGAEPLVVRPRDVMDQATPSGTSLAVELLLRVGHLSGRVDWEDAARRAMAHETGAMARMPAAFGRLLTQVVRDATDPVEVAIIGPRSGARDVLHRAAWLPYRVNRSLTGGDPTEDAFEGYPLLEGRSPPAGEAAAYVCRSYACEAPTTDPDEVTHLLRAP